MSILMVAGRKQPALALDDHTAEPAALIPELMRCRWQMLAALGGWFQLWRAATEYTAG